jgi:hypothetical protein
MDLGGLAHSLPPDDHFSNLDVFDSFRGHGQWVLSQDGEIRQLPDLDRALNFFIEGLPGGIEGEGSKGFFGWLGGIPALGLRRFG